MIQALNDQQYPNFIGSIFENCINYNVFFYSLNSLHVRREANQVFHCLAQYPLHSSVLFMVVTQHELLRVY